MPRTNHLEFSCPRDRGNGSRTRSLWGAPRDVRLGFLSRGCARPLALDRDLTRRASFRVRGVPFNSKTT